MGRGVFAGYKLAAKEYTKIFPSVVIESDVLKVDSAIRSYSFGVEPAFISDDREMLVFGAAMLLNHDFKASLASEWHSSDVSN